MGIVQALVLFCTGNNQKMRLGLMFMFTIIIFLRNAQFHRIKNTFFILCQFTLGLEFTYLVLDHRFRVLKTLVMLQSIRSVVRSWSGSGDPRDWHNHRSAYDAGYW